MHVETILPLAPHTGLAAQHIKLNRDQLGSDPGPAGAYVTRPGPGRQAGTGIGFRACPDLCSALGWMLTIALMIRPVLTSIWTVNMMLYTFSLKGNNKVSYSVTNSQITKGNRERQ